VRAVAAGTEEKKMVRTARRQFACRDESRIGRQQNGRDYLDGCRAGSGVQRAPAVASESRTGRPRGRRHGAVMPAAASAACGQVRLAVRAE